MFLFFNEMASEGALIRPQFGRAPEGDAACLGGAPAFLGSGGDQRALELRDTSKDGERRVPGPTALQILLQKPYISQMYYANGKSLFPHPAISLRNYLEICECRRASGAPPSGHGTAAFPMQLAKTISPAASILTRATASRLLLIDIATSSADTPSRFQRPSRADNSDVCVTQFRIGLSQRLMSVDRSARTHGPFHRKIKA